MTADETKDLYLFDIETEGLAELDHKVTTIGFKKYGKTGKHIIYYLDHGENVDAGEIESSSTVDLRSVDSEEEMFKEVYTFIDNNDINNPNKAAIIGFNSSKFDVSFLRTRVLMHNLSGDYPTWIFTDVNHMDVFKAIKYEFGTNKLQPFNAVSNLNKPKLVELEEYVIGERSGDNKSVIKTRLEAHEEDIDEDAMNFLLNKFDDLDEQDFIAELNDLDGVYEEMIDESHYTTVCDPFDDSKEAVESYHSGNMTDVIQHNVSDLERTDALLWLIINGVVEGEKSKLSTLKSVTSGSM